MTADLVTYFWILVFAFTVVMTLVGILRWIANPKKREKRLTILSICSFTILVCMLLMWKWETISKAFTNNFIMNNNSVSSLINGSQIIIKVLFLVLMAVFLLIFSLIIILLIICSGDVIISALKNKKADDIKEILQKKMERIEVILKNPVIIMAIVGGILTLYLILPLAVGKDKDNVVECWTNGVEQIADFCNADISQEAKKTTEDEVPNEIITSEGLEGTESTNSKENHSKLANYISVYSLVFISVLGIGYTIGNILFEIIKDGFEKKTGFLKQYSNSIGLLAVGISILYLISREGLDISNTSSTKLVVSFIKSFVLVIFVIALGIITLEIVRLLMDMKEKMIRREARYVFVLLVGLCTIIIMRAFSMIYGAISSTLGGSSRRLESAEERIQKVYDCIIEKIAVDMQEEINADNRVDGEIPYNVFKGTTTKK